MNGLLGTWDCMRQRMEGADKATKLWWLLYLTIEK